MNCKKVNKLLLSYLDNEVSPEERDTIQSHLSLCSGCREELETLAGTQKELRQAFESITAGVSPSAHAWEALKHRLTKEEQGRNSVLSQAKYKVKGWIKTMKSPRPVWQTALAGTMGVALIIGLFLTILSSPIQAPVTSAQLSKFSSYDELKNFISSNTQFYLDSYAMTKGSEEGILSFQGPTALGGAGPTGATGVTGDADLGGTYAPESYSAAGSEDYSSTNIQVEGVDEIDIVKTDGDFIYLVSRNRVIIVKAYPAGEAKILSEITPDESNSIDGIFISGDRLVLIHQYSKYWAYGGATDLKERVQAMPEPVNQQAPQAYIKVYDISDRANPVLARDMSVDGSYFGSRMVGDYVYIITNASVYNQNSELQLPAVHLGSTEVKIEAADIYYTNIPDYGYTFTIVTSVNAIEDSQEPNYQTIMMGSSSNLYVSLNNIYVASSVWSESSEKTDIQRIHISEGDIKYEASGEVPGRLLNQFSMDEYQDYFRVATTTTNWGGVRTGIMAPDGVNTKIAPESNTSANNVYILDMDLKAVGSVENLAPGEQIYSARFMGSKGYIVTFKKVDPLFVIDLANPNDPKVLGQLKITGYSDYLQPYDENHLLGIGKEAVAVDNGDFGLYQGVKISLFDVSDFANPKEIAKYEIGDRGTDSPVLRDHKALLFDREKNLLVLPIMLAEIDPAKYPYGKITPWTYGEPVWQGAYVFDISIDGGLQLKGRITHNDDPSQAEGYYGASMVKRSLYIGNVLYTLSDAKIKMNSLDDLSQINMVVLPE